MLHHFSCSGAPARRDDLDAALAAWEAVVGPLRVSVALDVIAAAGMATLHAPGRIDVTIAPGSVDELRACLAIATRYVVPVYPVSGGKNWGLGSKLPPRGRCVLVELWRLNEIIDFDEELAVITIQPGVTFRQISVFLAERKSTLFLPVIGGSPDASVIGNAVERGSGIGPSGERANAIGGLEILTPQGHILRTGFSRFPHARTARLSQHGVGPSLDGLFLQSNLGVVTQLSVWLTPRPAILSLYQGQALDAHWLGMAVDALRPLVLNDALGPCAITFWNTVKLLARQSQYSPLHAITDPSWFVSAALYSSSMSAAAAATSAIRTCLDGVLDGAAVRCVDPVAMTEHEAMFVGVPNSGNVGSTYWRKQMAVPPEPDPDRDRCGLIWLCPTLPFLGRDCVAAIGMIESTFAKYRFEANIGFNVFNARTLDFFVVIAYDRDIAGDDERAMACHDELMGKLIARGYLPSRLGIHSMTSLPDTNDDSDAFIDAIKKIADPANILSLGRYTTRDSSRPG
ncbi:FAD-binding oxidoreductase [Massilia mucilaginosa]|nr:FAD-binding oxidoreductase [Massilia mucilaginosa]